MSVKVRPYTKSKRVGFEVDISFTWPGSSLRFRRRYRAPVATEAQARAWGRAREVELITQGRDSELAKSKHEKPAAGVPKLQDFWPRFIREHCQANHHKPSGIDRKQNAFDVWIKP